MKKLLKTAVLGMAVAMGSAQASDSKFDGFNVGLGLGMAGTSTKVSIDEIAGIKVGDKATPVNLDLSYGLSIAPSFVMALGLTYDFNKVNYGSIEGGVIGSDAGSAKLTGNQHYSVYLQPTFAVNKSTAVFGKLGYHSMKGKLDVDGDVYSKTVSGYGYGLGVKTFIQDNVYIQVEAQRVDYKKESTSWLISGFGPANIDFKPSTSLGVVTLGVNFW